MVRSLLTTNAMMSHTRALLGQRLPDATLVEAARAGQPWAREVLFERHIGQVRGISKRMLGGQEGADDVAQDALVEAIVHLDALSEPRAFAAWMASIVARRALKYLRSHQQLLRLGLRSPVPADLDALASQAAPATTVMELRAAWAALDSLPEQERMVLILRRIHGLRLAEICDRMHLSLATAKRRLSAAEDHFEAKTRNPSGASRHEPGVNEVDDGRPRTTADGDETLLVVANSRERRRRTNGTAALALVRVLK